VHHADIIDEYRIDDLGAPFSVILERSVGMVRGEHGLSPVIPDPTGLVYETTAARARHPRRLSGADLLFMRRAVEMSREDFGHAMGSSEADIVAYEDGVRAIPAPLDGLMRVHAYHRLKSKMPNGLDRMIAFMDWLFDDHRYSPLHEAGHEMSFTFHYEDGHGWMLCDVDEEARA